MYWCNDCDHGFDEPMVVHGDEADEEYLACPYCESPDFKDVAFEADMLLDSMKEDGF